MATAVATLSTGIKHVSKRVVASYILDWLVIVYVSPSDISSRPLTSS
jgi:hypothetical protein